MIATIVSQSANAVQVFALVALILFVISTVANLAVKAWGIAVLTAGLALLSAAVLFLT